jgi:hypothetical protein
MRSAAWLGALLSGLVAVTPVAAQSEPVSMVVILPEVEVRSGGTTSFYATGKLQQGQAVQVVRESKEYPGWLAIKPPPGSFSWINARFVEETGPYLGKVVADPDTQVPVYPGSLVSNQTPNVEIAKLGRGSLVTILPGPPNFTSTGKWVPIAPTPQEVRYLPASAVKRLDAPQFAQGSNPHRVGTASGIGSVNLGTPYPPGHPHHTTSYNAGNAGWTPSNANGSTNQSGPFQATYNNATNTSSNQSAPARWSEYGILRKSSCRKDGNPMYVLLGRRGEVVLYASAANGASLEPYVNRVVSLYGRLTYSTDPMWRNYVMNATHITVP